MKKLIFLFALALSLCATNKVQAYDFSAVNADGVTIYYNITNATTQEVEVTYKTSAYNSYSGVVNIPSEVTNGGITYTVTKIGDNAFRSCTALTSVTISEGVETIGGAAFYDCSGLTPITIPNSVTSIGGRAFQGCSSLTYITIPERVTTIGNAAFSDCDSLTSVTFHCPTIGNWFSGMTSLTSVTIGNTVDTIGNAAFQGCSSLTSITISNSVTTIESFAFEGCIGLTSITIPNSVTSIGGSAFRDCTALTSVTIPESVTTIGVSAFLGCSSLTSVTIPNGVTTIGSSAFNGCSRLTSVTIPESVTTIGHAAFSGCDSLTSVTFHCPTIGNWFSGMTSLTSVTIGNTVDTIGEKAFYGCRGLTSVTILDGVTSIENSAFRECSGLTSITIPNSLTSIGDWTTFSGCSGLASVTFHCPTIGNWFSGMTSLTSVTIGNTVETIVENAFAGCDSLTSVTFHCPTIGNWFSGMTSLTSVTIGNTVETIGENAFSGCIGLASVTIPESVTIIGESAFSGCDSLTSVTFHCPTIGNWFSGMTSMTSVTIGNTVETIGENAFQGCSSLTSITIPNSVTSIGNRAFAGCIGLTSVTIPESVTTIGVYAFFDCIGLTSVTIPNSVTTIESSAFLGCSSLTSVTIPNGVTTIGSSAFNGCSRLTSVAIPESVTTIGMRAFFDCSGLISVTIPESVREIGMYAFYGCIGLTSVSIPNSVTEIERYTFYGCSNLTSVTIPDGVTTIGESAFSGCSALEGVILGTGVSSIGNEAFALSSESNQELTIYSRNSIPPATGDNVIEGRSNVQVIVQCGYETAYQDIDGNGTNWLGLSDNNISQDRINLIEDVAWQNGSYSGNGFNIEDVGNGGIFIRRSETISYGCYNSDILNLTVVPRSGTLTSKAGEWVAENAGAWTQTSAETTQWIVSNGSKVRFNSQPETGTITVKDGGELIAEVEIPNVTVEKTILPNQWNFMGFPIIEPTGVSSLAATNIDGDIWALAYNYTQNTWNDQYLYWNDNFQSLVVQGNGILAYPAQNETLLIQGTVPASGSNITVTNPVSGPYGGNRYMAVANPYAEKLDVATFIANNSGVLQGTNAVYRYDGATYSLVIEAGDKINVAEGFFVNMLPEKTTVTLKNTPNSTTAKAATREYIRLSVSTEGYKVPVYFAANDGASNSYDDFDANKLFGNGTVAEPYLLTDDIMLCKEEVKTLPYTAEMNVHSEEARTVEVSLDRLPEQYTLILVDGEDEIPMQEDDTYTANLASGENSDRFQLKIGKGAVSIQDIAQAETLDIRANNRHITIIGAANLTTVVYNALGQKVYETKAHSFDLNGIEAGVYVVKSRSGELSQTLKIIIQ